MDKPKTPCLIPNCTGRSRARGLCFNHYRVAQKRVDAGLTTWQELIKLGLVKMTAPDTFDLALKEARIAAQT